MAELRGSDARDDVIRVLVLSVEQPVADGAADLPRVFAAGRAFFDAHPDVTGAQLYAHVVGLAEAAGWAFGGPHSGHLVGEFPHEMGADEPGPAGYKNPFGLHRSPSITHTVTIREKACRI